MSNVTSRWAVAIFTARETPSVLSGTVRAVIAACAGRQATIDVLINGNQQLAALFADVAATFATGGCTLRIWSIAAPDKAHTWNEYVHRIWDTGGITFFIDGYARVRPGALAAIEHRLATSPDALAASGVPTSGRSAKRLREGMLRTGGIHGNLYALKATSMSAIRNAGFRLPLGLYRTDPLLGAALCFRLDPANNQWKRGTVVAVADATWDVDGISELNYKNVVAYFKRQLRQAHGTLETRAVREHMTVNRLPPQLLPATAQDMINQWLSAQPEQARAMFLKHPSCLYAARQLRAPRDWSATQVAPLLLCTHTSETAHVAA
ncbi:hypothetical protein ACHAC9_12000 [Massilia sp. CMS3.1]|uniref:hypothetical protein n=1 Tax=Massilia sp. CMS3.1 TaxID=3373083 RepID=UPI003EE7FAAF